MPSRSLLVLAAALFGAPAAPAQPVHAPSADAPSAEAAALDAVLVVEWASALVREIEARREAHPAADPVAPFRRLVGDWAGTLTYTDYGDDSTRVELGVRIAVTERRDSLDTPALEFRYAFTEPDGRAFEGARDLLVPGTDPARLWFGGAAWTVVARDTTGGRLRLVVEREGDDDNRPATIRETLTAGPEAWTLVNEVRYAGTAAFFERYTFVLRRAEG